MIQVNTLNRYYFGVDLPEETNDALCDLAESQGVSPKVLVEQAIIRYVEVATGQSADVEPGQQDSQKRYCVPCGRTRPIDEFYSYERSTGTVKIDTYCRHHRTAYARQRYHRRKRREMEGIRFEKERDQDAIAAAIVQLHRAHEALKNASAEEVAEWTLKAKAARRPAKTRKEAEAFVAKVRMPDKVTEAMLHDLIDFIYGKPE